jgi:hypothetical protein
MEGLPDILIFLYELMKKAISAGFFLLMCYIVFYGLLKIICCGNNKSEYKQFRKTFNTMCMNFLKSLYELSIAALDTAKTWSRDKIESNHHRR